MPRKVIISASGTGGHLFPAQVLAEQLEERGCEVVFVAGGLKRSPYFASGRFPCRDVSAGGLSLKGVVKLCRGVCESVKIIRQEGPDLVVGFGSFHSAPALLAARLTKTPYLLHEANARPGKVNRWLSKGARVTGVHFPGTHLKGKTAPAAIPLKHPYADVSCAEARGALGLKDAFTVLIFGGSQGARALNEAAQGLDAQLIHLTGRGGKETDQGYTAEFEERMDLCYAAADLAITRAGASTVAELEAWALPALLVPYPYAADNHQEANADYFVGLGGGLRVLERDIEQLPDLVEEVRPQIASMRENLLQNRSPQTGDLYNLVCEQLCITSLE